MTTTIRFTGDLNRCCICGAEGSFACGKCITRNEWAKVLLTREGDLLFNGRLNLWPLLTSYRRKIVRCHAQTTLTLVQNVPGSLSFQIKYRLRRLKWRLLWNFADVYVTMTEGTKRQLEEFGIKDVVLIGDAHHNLVKVERKAHDGINILYYWPARDRNQKFKRWAYGYDKYRSFKKAVEILKCVYPDIRVNFIEVDGTKSNRKMREILAVTDILFSYLRFPHHPRLVDECRLNGIRVVGDWEEGIEAVKKQAAGQGEDIEGIV